MPSNHGARAASRKTPAQAFRRLLESTGTHQGPICHDALSAKLVERAGFPFTFMGGFAVSSTRLGLPDVGLISYGEMFDQGFLITQAVSIPVIGDGDTGYGSPMNVKRTVKGFIKAGFAGILLEDQLSPKACGHTRGRKVVSREEAVMRIRAAIDARNESDSDFVIIARTDARQAMSLEEALWRSRAFADVGADAIFVDALASIEEMKAFCQIAPSVPKMANMLEGGGKTPLLSPTELQEIGYKFVVYPLSLFGVSIRAMQEALTALRDGRIPSPEILPSFEDIKEIVGFNEYYEEEEQYKISEPVAEADSKERSSDEISSQTLRLKLTKNNGHEKLDARISVGFLEGMSSMISGMDAIKNVMEVLKNASLEGMPEKGKLLADFYATTGDRIQVFVE